MNKTGYVLISREGHYEGKSYEILAFSSDKSELEAELSKINEENKKLKQRFVDSEPIINEYVAKFNSDRQKHIKANVIPFYEPILKLPVRKPITKEETKEWVRIKDVNFRADEHNLRIHSVLSKKFVENWRIENPPSSEIENFIEISDHQICKIYFGEFPKYFVTEMNSEFR